MAWLELQPDAWILRGGRHLRGTVRVPGDKSIGHRVVLAAALARGQSTLRGLSGAADVAATLAAVQALGARVTRHPEALAIDGFGLEGARAPETPVDCGNSGTTMRLMTGWAASRPFRTRFEGDASLSRRPMRRIAAPLQAMGARVRCFGPNGRPPLEVEGPAEGLQGIRWRLDVDSAQVRSAVWLAGLTARGPTHLWPRGQARDHTQRLFRALGVRLEAEDDGETLYPPGASWDGFTHDVPGDLSAAAFWIAASAAQGGGVTIESVGLNPGRCGFLDVLRRAGAQLSTVAAATILGEPMGRIDVEGGGLGTVEIAGADTVRCIDEIPALLAAAAIAGCPARLRDAGELRYKESDRIAAMATTLTAFGGRVHAAPDGLDLEPGTRLQAARVDSFGDHRIAMAAAMLATVAPGTSRIEGVDCVRTSYPEFARHLLLLAH